MGGGGGGGGAAVGLCCLLHQYYIHSTIGCVGIYGCMVTHSSLYDAHVSLWLLQLFYHRATNIGLMIMLELTCRFCIEVAHRHYVHDHYTAYYREGSSTRLFLLGAALRLYDSCKPAAMHSCKPAIGMRCDQ